MRLLYIRVRHKINNEGMLVYFLHKILLFLSYVEINFYQQNRLSIMFLDIIFMQNYESEVSAIKKNSII